MKTILITGASKGIGYHTALELANAGHHVVALARSENKLSDLKNESTSGAITPVGIDISKPDQYSILETALSSIGKIDGLINNAGLLINTPFMESTIDELRAQFEVNVFSIVRLIQFLKPKLSEGSHIVNIGSMGGFQGSDKFPGLSGYSASKGALAILSECLNVELAEFGVSVNCLALGAVQTEMLAQAFPGYQAPTEASTMGRFIADFVLSGHTFFSGKILPVALNNPG